MPDACPNVCFCPKADIAGHGTVKTKARSETSGRRWWCAETFCFGPPQLFHREQQP